ncbi:hypothetical protein CMV00_14030 [Elizabethkingia anophelis]|nr:hypothetical protein [Elizabethkingia anophelis]
MAVLGFIRILLDCGRAVNFFPVAEACDGALLSLKAAPRKLIFIWAVVPIAKLLFSVSLVRHDTRLKKAAAINKLPIYDI